MRSPEGRIDGGLDLLQKYFALAWILRLDQSLRVALEIAPAEQIHADFAPERAFVG